nr:unnamed protein product [Callosobruchus chinensis]
MFPNISIFQLSGLGIIIAGALVLADVSDFSHFVTSDLVGPPIVLIVLGTIIFLVASLGCYGAIRENYKMLIALALQQQYIKQISKTHLSIH